MLPLSRRDFLPGADEAARQRVRAAVALFGELPRKGVHRRGGTAALAAARHPDRGGTAVDAAGLARRGRRAAATVGRAAPVTTGMCPPARHPSAPEWAMLRVLAREALAVATLHGAAQLSFRGYRVAATRLCAAGTDGAFVEITLAGNRGGEPLDRVRIAVASRSDAGSACRIDPRTRRRLPRARPSLSLAVSARLMPVTHRPKPVRSPENRWPQGPEISSVLLPSRGVPSPHWDGLSISMCSMSCRRPSCPSHPKPAARRRSSTCTSKASAISIVFAP